MRTMANRLMSVVAVSVFLSVAAPSRAAAGSVQGMSDMVQALMEFLTGQSFGAEVSLLAQHQNDSHPGNPGDGNDPHEAPK